MKEIKAKPTMMQMAMPNTIQKTILFFRVGAWASLGVGPR
jgi:hypothetical protein